MQMRFQTDEIFGGQWREYISRDPQQLKEIEMTFSDEKYRTWIFPFCDGDGRLVLVVKENHDFN